MTDFHDTQLHTGAFGKNRRSDKMSAETGRETASTLTWFIGLATAIVAGGYIYLAESSLSDLARINAQSNAVISHIEANRLAPSLLASPPDELTR